MKKIILSFLIVFLFTDISVGEDKKDFEGMVFIKGGCFKMGDQFGEGWNDEKPPHEVCVDDFYMGEHEVTQGEWEEIVGNNPSYFKSCGDDCPVEQVAYDESYYKDHSFWALFSFRYSYVSDDIKKYIRRINNKTGLNYRLPTEAEWEYAAREGGRMVRFGTGKDTIGPDEANFDASSTVPVKSFPPNALGLYDMTGNVWEWVSDWYGKNYYSNSPRNNPKGPSSGSYRVIRGGSWSSSKKFVRSAFRIKNTPLVRFGSLGFRLALGVSDQD